MEGGYENRVIAGPRRPPHASWYARASWVPGRSVPEWRFTVPCREPVSAIGIDMRLGSTTELCRVAARVTRSSANSRHEPHPRPAPSRSTIRSASEAEHSVPGSHPISAAASTSCWSVTQLHRQTYTAWPRRLNWRRIVNRNDSVLQQKSWSRRRTTPPCEKRPCNQLVGTRFPEPDSDAAGLQVGARTIWRVDQGCETAGPECQRTAPRNAQEPGDCPNPVPVIKALRKLPLRYSRPRTHFTDASR